MKTVQNCRRPVRVSVEDDEVWDGLCARPRNKKQGKQEDENEKWGSAHQNCRGVVSGRANLGLSVIQFFVTRTVERFLFRVKISNFKEIYWDFQSNFDILADISGINSEPYIRLAKPTPNLYAYVLRITE